MCKWQYKPNNLPLEPTILWIGLIANVFNCRLIFNPSAWWILTLEQKTQDSLGKECWKELVKIHGRACPDVPTDWSSGPSFIEECLYNIIMERR